MGLWQIQKVRVIVDLEVMAITGYTTLTKFSGIDIHDQIQLMSYLRTFRSSRSYPPCRGTLGIFYSPSRRGGKCIYWIIAKLIFYKISRQDYVYCVVIKKVVLELSEKYKNFSTGLFLELNDPHPTVLVQTEKPWFQITVTPPTSR